MSGGGYGVAGIFRETASGASANRAARNQVMDLAQTRQIDAVPVSELSRWGRSIQGLLATLHRLAGWKVSVVAMNGMTFEPDTPHGRMMATMLAGIAQFERDLISEQVKPGLAAAKARGKKLGRQPGQRPKPDKLAPKVLQAVSEGRNYRWIARDLGISKNTVPDVVKRTGKLDKCALSLRPASNARTIDRECDERRRQNAWSVISHSTGIDPAVVVLFLFQQIDLFDGIEEPSPGVAADALSISGQGGRVSATSTVSD